MGVQENLQVMNLLKSYGVADGNTQFVITHFSHNSAPFIKHLSEIERQYGFIAAYDGLEIEI